MATEDNPHIRYILNTVRNGYMEKQMSGKDLDIVYTYIDLFVNKKLPEILLSNTIPPLKALKMLREYTKSFGKLAAYDKFFEIDAITIRRIIRPNKNLKVTFVDVDGELSIMLYDEDNITFGLYDIKENNISVATSVDLVELKGKFENNVDGLKLLLNDDLSNKLGIKSENTTTVTIDYETHFSTIDLNDLKTIYLFPAIDAETTGSYKHRITFVMFFAYKLATDITTFHDTFQICPPDGC